jgi:hypothetical protein
LTQGRLAWACRPIRILARLPAGPACG